MVYAAQPREGTETSHHFHSTSYQSWVGLCSSTPRGDGNKLSLSAETVSYSTKVYAAQPREGTETVLVVVGALLPHLAVYAAQPREGTETRQWNSINNWMKKVMVYAAQPREGTETLWFGMVWYGLVWWFMQLNPARGRKP